MKIIITIVIIAATIIDSMLYACLMCKALHVDQNGETIRLHRKNAKLIPDQRSEKTLTLKELSQLYHLNNEIILLDEQLKDLQDASTRITSTVSDMPRTGRSPSPTTLGADIAEVKKMLEATKQARIAEYNRLMRYIDSVEDSYIRQILTLRFIKGLQWEAIADKLHTTSWSVKHTCYRFIDKK